MNESLEEIVNQNLSKLFNSENQSIHKNDFIEFDEINEFGFNSILDLMINEDLIEIEEDENIYYLTTKGYDCYESGWFTQTNKNKKNNLDSMNEEIQSFGRNKYHYYTFVLLGLFGLIFSITYMNSFRKPTNKLPDEAIEKAYNELIRIKDSIKK